MVAEVEEQQRLMQAQPHKFIAKQEEENVWMREQIAQLCSFYASEAAPNAPSAPPPPCTKMDSPMAQVQTHATSSNGGDTEMGERTA